MSARDIKSLTAQQVAGWVANALKMPQYRTVFEEEGVGGQALLGLSERQLRLDLRVSSKTHRNTIMRAVSQVRHSCESHEQQHAQDQQMLPPADSSSATPLALLLQERHQCSLRGRSAVSRKQARRRELDYQMWVSGVDSFAGAPPEGDKSSSGSKDPKRWPEEAVGPLRRVVRAVGGSQLSLPEAFEAFKSPSNDTDTVQLDEFKEVCAQMGEDVSQPSVLASMAAVVKGRMYRGGQKGIKFWDFVRFFAEQLNSSGADGASAIAAEGGDGADAASATAAGSSGASLQEGTVVLVQEEGGEQEWVQGTVVKLRSNGASVDLRLADGRKRKRVAVANLRPLSEEGGPETN